MDCSPCIACIQMWFCYFFEERKFYPVLVMKWQMLSVSHLGMLAVACLMFFAVVVVVVLVFLTLLGRPVL